MHTIRRTEGDQTLFIFADVAPEYARLVRGFAYHPVDEGFAKRYPSTTPGLDRIYKNFALHAETMVRQAARLETPPWEAGLLAFLERIAGHRIRWWLRGSAALAARGLAIVPGDIDLSTDDDGAQRLAELFQDALVEPLVPVQGWFCRWWGRAFLHTRIEWVGGVEPTADEPEPSDFGPEAERRAERIDWRGHTLLVPPLDLQLRTTERRGLDERAALIRRFLASDSAA